MEDGAENLCRSWKWKWKSSPSPPLLMDILVTKSEWVGGEMRPKEEEFHASLPVSVPCVDVSEELTPKQWRLCFFLQERKFSVRCQLYFFGFLGAHTFLAHTHARQSKASHTLFLNGSCCIPFFFLHTSMPFNIHLHFSPMQFKAQGWWKQKCHWWRSAFFTNKRSIHCG